MLQTIFCTRFLQQYIENILFVIVLKSFSQRTMEMFISFLVSVRFGNVFSHFQLRS